MAASLSLAESFASRPGKNGGFLRDSARARANAAQMAARRARRDSAQPQEIRGFRRVARIDAQARTTRANHGEIPAHVRRGRGMT